MNEARKKREAEAAARRLDNQARWAAHKKEEQLKSGRGKAKKGNVNPRRPSGKTPFKKKEMKVALDTLDVGFLRKLLRLSRKMGS